MPIECPLPHGRDRAPRKRFAGMLSGFFLPAIALAAAISLISPTISAGQSAAPASATAGGVPVGKASRVQNEVTASVGERRLKASDPVFQAELVRAGQRSFGELLLNDDSKILVGENAEISLDDFVVGGTGFESATLNVAKGAFRFISGNSAKGTFTVKTPLSTIGVRGTIFDVYVGEGGVTNVVLLRGVVRVCSLNNSCLTASRSCDIIEVRSPETVERKPFLRSASRSAAQESNDYNLLSKQGRFERRWRAPTVSCNSRAALELQQNRTRNNNNGDEGPEPDEGGRGDDGGKGNDDGGGNSGPSTPG